MTPVDGLQSNGSYMIVDEFESPPDAAKIAKAARRRRLPPAPFETKANREAEHGIRAALHRAFVRLRAKLAEQLRHESWKKQAVRKGYDPNDARHEDDHAHKADDEVIGYWTSAGFSKEPPTTGATAEKVRIRKGAEERDDHGRWTTGGGGSEPSKPETGPFTAAERERGLAALKAAPEAEEGYRHFDEYAGGDNKVKDGGPQVALKDIGFAPNPQIFGCPSSERKWREMNVPLANIGRGQSSVTRDGVERKLNGETIGLGNDPIPHVVLSDGKFYVQGGHHRAAAAMLAGRTHIRALVTERVGGRKYKKPDAVGKAFDPDQPRDDRGRWGEGSSTTVEHGHDGYKITLSTGGEKIGEAHLRWNEKEGVAELETLGIKGDAQGQGAGSKLLDESIAFAADRWPGKTLLVATTEPKLKGALESRGATPHSEHGDLMVLHLPARKVEKAAGDEDDPEWVLAGEIAARLDLGEISFVVDDVGSALDVVASSAGSATLGAIGVDDQRIVDQIDLAAADWARDRSAELVGMRYDAEGNLVEAARASMRIDESTRDMVRETLYQGLVEGKRSAEIADELESGSRETDYPFSEERAALIANTEIRRAHNEGSLSGMRGALDAGVEVKKSWITSGHDTVCDDCDENEAIGPIDVEDEFPSGDDSAPAHPNCNCDIVAEVPETPSEEQED